MSEMRTRGGFAVLTLLSLASGCARELEWTVVPLADRPTAPLLWGVWSGTCSASPGALEAAGQVGTDPVPRLPPGRYCLAVLDLETGARGSGVCRLHGVALHSIEEREYGRITMTLAEVPAEERPDWDPYVLALDDGTDQSLSCAPVCDSERCACPGSRTCRRPAALAACSAPIESTRASATTDHACVIAPDPGTGADELVCWGARTGWDASAAPTDIALAPERVWSATTTLTDVSTGPGLTCARELGQNARCFGAIAPTLANVCTNCVLVAASDTQICGLEERDASNDFVLSCLGRSPLATPIRACGPPPLPACPGHPPTRLATVDGSFAAATFLRGQVSRFAVGGSSLEEQVLELPSAGGPIDDAVDADADGDRVCLLRASGPVHCTSGAGPEVGPDLRDCNADRFAFSDIEMGSGMMCLRVAGSGRWYCDRELDSCLDAQEVGFPGSSVAPEQALPFGPGLVLLAGRYVTVVGDAPAEWRGLANSAPGSPFVCPP